MAKCNQLTALTFKGLTKQTRNLTTSDIAKNKWRKPGWIYQNLCLNSTVHFLQKWNKQSDHNAHISMSCEAETFLETKRHRLVQW